MASKRRTRAEKAADEIVERIACSGIAIPMLEIPKMFAEGRKALAAGLDVDATVRAYVETIRVAT